MTLQHRIAFLIFVFIAVASLAFAAGFVLSVNGYAAEKKKRVVYPKETRLDFEGIQIDGELRNPGEFYFQHRKPEKFKSLIQRRKNFHRELLRDALLSR